MSFFRIVFSLCSGTELFPKIAERFSLFRAFFHLFLLLVFCTVGIILSAWLLNRDNVNLVCSRFMERTGGLTLTPDAIVLGKDSDRSRGYKLSDTFRFDYFAKTKDCTEDFLKEKRELYGIFCFPSGAVFWIRDPRHELPKYRLMILPADVIYNMAFQAVSPDALIKLQKQNAETLYTPAEVSQAIRKDLHIVQKTSEKQDKDKALQRPFKISKNLIAAQALAIMIIFNISAYLVEVLLSLILVLIFFSLAQKFRFSSAPKKLTYQTILTLTIYAAFPAIIAATFFQMMQLQLLSFQTVFFIVFFVYQIFAFNRVFEFLYPRRSTPDETDDEL